MNLTQTSDHLIIKGKHFHLTFNRALGEISDLSLRHQEKWLPVLQPGSAPGLNAPIPASSVEVLCDSPDGIVFKVEQRNDQWAITTRYEVFARGYIVGTFSMEALADGAETPSRRIAMSLDEETVFSRQYRIVNENPGRHLRQAIRGYSVLFSVDERPVTHCVDFLLEMVTLDMTGKPLHRCSASEKGSRQLGWQIMGDWAYPFPKGYRYQNRWCMTFTTLNHDPNPVRGQRIYHWFGNQARAFACPDEHEMLEMAEYGCTLLIMHLPTLSQADTQEFRHPKEMQRTVRRAHELGMKVLVYTNPYLVRRLPEVDPVLRHQRTECLKVWSASAKEHQIVSYDPDLTEYDADELNLRHPEAFNYVREHTLDVYHRYQLDGLYVDYAWPAQGIAPNPEQDNAPGLFNFYDYHRLLREYRKAIGPDALMIGHGGGFLVSSDMVEGFDACLTGEAQHETDPCTLGQPFGCAPTLWIIQRRKRDAFRSERTVENCIKEALTPHVGICVHGQSVIATTDPAYFPGMIALWQMWRAFPMHRAQLFHYLSHPAVVHLDNPEVVYSLYVTAEKQLLLLLANQGGPLLEAAPAVGVTVTIDIEHLHLPKKMNCWRIKGDRYENIRIAPIAPIEDGTISVPELDHHEFIALILSPDEPPEELRALERHLEGRFERLVPLMKAKQERMRDLDAAIDRFSHYPNAKKAITYEQFMEGRVTE